jgi:peptidoglycan-N-acetylglucosamine deacetylase
MIPLFKPPMFLKWIFPKRHWGFFSSSEIFLTFDDGPCPHSTPYILDFLRANDMKATFFCVGENVQKYPDLFQQIIEEGHSVGNHTMRHLKRTKTSFRKYRADIEEANQLISSKLFRPPYGRLYWWDDFRLSKDYQIVLWNWIAYDFDLSVSVESIVLNAKENVNAGDILVLHDNQKTIDRVKSILPQLHHMTKQKGLKVSRIPTT